VKKFISYYKKGMLPRGKPFSVYYKAHREQAIALFELFYYANDYDTFYKVMMMIMIMMMIIIIIIIIIIMMLENA
jgi:hypothetical protein